MSAARKDPAPPEQKPPQRVTADEIAAAFESALNNPQVREDPEEPLPAPKKKPARPVKKR